MDVEQTRAFLLKLPHVAETMQWGANLVYSAGDKAIGGKMFALLNLDEEPSRRGGRPAPVASFYVGPERYAELLETEGVLPAPYFARLHWVALAHWNVFIRRELEALLKNARTGTLEKLSRRTRELLALPKQQREDVIAERKLLLQRAAIAKRAASLKVDEAQADYPRCLSASIRSRSS